MTISALIGSRLLSGIGALVLTGSLVGTTAIAASPSNSVSEIRHEVRDQSKVQRDEIKQMRAEFAAEYGKDQPNTAELARLHADIEAKRGEISDLRFNALMQMHDELDAKQRERMLAHTGKAKAKANGKAERGGDKAERGKAKASDAKARGGDKAERGKAKASDAKARGGEMAERGKPKAKAGEAKAKAKANQAAPV